MYAEFLPLMASHGVDPRDFAIVAYGGAGPTHAFLLAREVGIRRVIVPPNPGTLCALGSLLADLRGDFVHTLYTACDELTDADLADALAGLRAQAQAWLVAQHTPVASAIVLQAAGMRYTGQSYEIAVSLGNDPRVVALVSAFHDRYRAIYGYSDEDAPVELIDVRTTIVGVVPKPSLARLAPPPAAPRSAARRVVYYDRGITTATVYARSQLTPCAQLAGPAVIEQYDTTTFVPPGFTVRVDEFGNLLGDAY